MLNPIIYLVLACLAALLLGPAISMSSKSRKRWALIITTAAFAIIAISSLYVLLSSTPLSIFNHLQFSPFSAFFVFIFSISLVLVSLLSYAYSDHYSSLSFMLSLSFIAMFIIATSQSLLSIFIGLELITVTTSFMILFHGKHKVEAAVKLFITGSLSIALFSFALALLYQYSPSFSLSSISIPLNVMAGMAVLSLAFFLASIGFECALFPFNFWVSDVYQGAPTFVTSLMAGVNKKVGFLVLIEVFFTVFVLYSHIFSPLLEILSILTMFFGNILALSQNNLKRMFIYSSISQAGYILIGLATASSFGVISSLFYIFAHSFMIIGAFAIVLFLESNNIKSIDDCTGLYSRNGFIAIALTIIMLSMAGIPTLIGFFGKLQLFSSAIYSHMVLLAIFGIINSLISIYYYGRVMNALFQRKKERVILNEPYVTAVVLIVLIIIILFGLHPQPLVHMASAAYNSLISPSVTLKAF